MKKCFALLCAVVLAFALPFSVCAQESGYLYVSQIVPPDSGTDVSTAIQKLIEENPHRTLFFADGEYLLAKPILTPADPNRSVSLKLADFAVFRACGDWEKGQALVQLGAEYPVNNTSIPGSNYSFEGGILDGMNIADGISINGGRETAVRNVSMKHTVTGLHILYGANSGSSDADISGLNIIGTNTKESTGLLIEGYDNTFTNIRIGAVYTGVHIRSCGNVLRNIHPLYYGDYTDYPDSCGFLDEYGNNWYDFCYSDQFGTGFRTTCNAKNVYNDCYCYWYSPNGESHTAFRADEKFNSVLTNFRADLPEAENGRFISIGKIGGKGIVTNPLVSRDRIVSGAYKAYDPSLPLIVRFFCCIVLLFETI